MRCKYCGYEIPEGELYCPKCGKEVFIVPEYNPLDDMLAAEIKVGVNGEGDHSSDSLYDFSQDVRNRTSSRRRTGGTQGTAARRNTGRTSGRQTGRNTGRNISDSSAERERRRRQAEMRRAQLKKKRRNLLLGIGAVLIVLIAGVILLYQNSYSGVVGRGYKALEKKEYGDAETFFSKALEKNHKKPDAYTGLSKVYIAQDATEKAEGLFTDAIEKQTTNVGLYEACIHFYIDTKQQMAIPLLLDDAEESVVEKLEDYIIEEPKFNLDDSEVYEDVQQLEITTSADVVYYTVDGTEPTLESTKYKEPVQIKEGENVIKAISVDKRGIPSMPVTKTYVVELPMEDAPVVSPSTGQYESAQTIEVKVPEGYSAYYTMNGEDPTTASSKYTGPIDMPQGDTLFKVVLVTESGRMSGITTRNYMLEIEE